MGRLLGCTVLVSALITQFGILTAPLLLLIAADMTVGALMVRAAGR